MNFPSGHSPTLDRRTALKGLAAAGLAAGLGRFPEIEVEAAPVEPPKEVLEGYTDLLSYEAGDRVRMNVSTSARTFNVEIARVGATRETVWMKEGVAGVRHPTPDDSFSHGCRWPSALELQVPKEWRSGYYSVLLRGEGTDGKPLTGEMFFVVRSANPGREASILIQLCTNTYNAYNTWGGSSLYGGPKAMARRVSFDRPWIGFQPGRNFTNTYSGWRNWEKPFVEWAEQAGYCIDYAVNSDLELRPEILKPYRLVLSVGHDEYWSWPMRDSLEAFIGDGGNVAFFSGNTAFWQVRSEDSARNLVCWKSDFDKDPVYKQDDLRFLSGMWSNRLVGRPENQLTGVSFSYAGYHRFAEHGGDGCYTIHRPDHWMFAGTNLKRGDRLGRPMDNLVGYECDGCLMDWRDGVPTPTFEDGTPKSFEILGTATAGLSMMDRSAIWVAEALFGKNTEKRVDPLGAAVLGCYSRGGTVVTSGCTEWVNGLRHGNPQVERITRNVLDRLST